MARPFSRPARRYVSESPNASRYESANALVASGFKVGKGEMDTMRRISQTWQRRAFAYYNVVPEIKYAAQFYSRALSVLRLFVGERQDDGTVEESTNDVAIGMLDRVQDPGGGGREGLLSTYGRLMFLAGECYLVATVDDDDREQWEMLSNSELRLQGEDYVRYRAPALPPEQIKEPSDDDFAPIDKETAVVYRLWKRHPEYSILADCSMQGVLDVCEELVLLTQAVRARAKSRLAQGGILLVNGRYIPLPPEPAPSEDPQVDRFMVDLIDAFTSPIVNEGSAASVVPHVVRIDSDENLDNVMKMIQVIDPMATYPETGLRMELIKRLSIGLDMPPEILVGLADSNHWNAWQVDEQTWKGHLQPVANQLVADLTTSFFQPSLKKEGVADWERFVIQYDATDVINHPDRGKDAKDLYDRGELSGDSLREATGFTEDEDVPTEEERWRYIGIKTHDASMAIFGIPSIRSGGIEPAAGEILDSAGTQGDPIANGGGGNEVEKGAPATPATPENVVGGAYLEANIARILGASEVAFWRSREIAGSRIRSAARKDDEATKILDGVPARQVAARLGAERAAALKLPAARTLVEGGSELLAETLLLWGLDVAIAEPLGERLEQFAASTLFVERPGPLPPSFANYVVGLATSSNGNGAS